MGSSFWQMMSLGRVLDVGGSVVGDFHHYKWWD